MSKTKIILLLSLLLYFAVFNFLRNNYLYTTILDDSFIFFRYAENVFNGFGFVWNIGEQPVEGYSSFFYLVLLIIAKSLTLNLELFAIVLGTVTSALTLFYSYLIYELLFSNNNKTHTANIVTVIILTLSPACSYWSGAGMETSLYSMFIVLTFYYFLKLPENSKSSLLKGILFGILCVIRFEAVLFFVIATYYQLKAENSYFKIKLTKSSFLLILGFTIIFGTYFIWRWSYFGYFLPNTFYAKTGGGLQQIAGGFLYVIKALRLFYGFAWIPILLVSVFFRKEMIKKQSAFLLFVGIASLLTTVLVGGDHFHLGRFVLAILPFLFVFFPPALANLLSTNFKTIKLNPSIVVGILLISIFALLLAKPVNQETFRGFQNLLSDQKKIIEVYDKSTEREIVEWQNGFVIMGKTLNKIADKNDYIAAVPIGAIGYYSKIGVIDMVGIVDPIIAHEKLAEDHIKKWTAGHTKGDGNYILSRKPKFIQLTDYLTRTPLEKPHKRSLQFKSVEEIWNAEDFHREYEFYPVEVIDGWYYNLFKRK